MKRLFLNFPIIATTLVVVPYIGPWLAKRKHIASPVQAKPPAHDFIRLLSENKTKEAKRALNLLLQKFSKETVRDLIFSQEYSPISNFEIVMGNDNHELLSFFLLTHPDIFAEEVPVNEDNLYTLGDKLRGIAFKKNATKCLFYLGQIEFNQYVSMHYNFLLAIKNNEDDHAKLFLQKLLGKYSIKKINNHINRFLNHFVLLSPLHMAITNNNAELLSLLLAYELSPLSEQADKYQLEKWCFKHRAWACLQMLWNQSGPNGSLFTVTVDVFLEYITAELSKEKINEIKLHREYASIPKDKSIDQFNEAESDLFLQWLYKLIAYPQSTKNKELIKAISKSIQSIRYSPITYIMLQRIISYYDHNTDGIQYRWNPSKLSVINCVREISKKGSGRAILNMHEYDQLFLVFKKYNTHLANSGTGTYNDASSNYFDRICLALIAKLELYGFSYENIRPNSAHFSNIGIIYKGFKEVHPDDIIIVGGKSYLVSEINSSLEKYRKFMDPMHYTDLEPKVIAICLTHPKIKKALIALHQAYLASEGNSERVSSAALDCLDDLSKALLNNSHDTHTGYNEEAANQTLTVFHQRMQDFYRKDRDLMRRKFYFLRTRNGALTNYDALFCSATYDGCTGQLGFAIAEYVKAFRANNALDSTASPYSTYIAHPSFYETELYMLDSSNNTDLGHNLNYYLRPRAGRQ
jgi:hypothetical protein